MTECEIAEECHISYGSVQGILTENIGTTRVSAKLLTGILTPDQKTEHVAVAIEMLRQPTEDPSFTASFRTEEENWVYGYDLETKA